MEKSSSTLQKVRLLIHKLENEMNMKFVTGAVLTALLLPSLALAQIDTRATFAVTKTFADGNNVDEVTVSIDCNTGIILDQDKILEDGESVEFVVTDFTSGTLNCEITETDGTDGYSAEYVSNGPDTSECAWTAITDGTAGTCDITNSPDAVEIIVTKEWIIVGENNDVDLEYSLRAKCSNVFYDHSQQADVESGYWKKVGYANGEGPADDEFSFWVRPGFPSSSCYVNENVDDSAIEIDNGCGDLTISAGEGTSCTIINTVFFEGIPTLSQYGMAIMALLMLGVGFVGFRRFV
jgi:hypothetical protein